MASSRSATSPPAKRRACQGWLRNCSRDGWRGHTSSRDSLSIKFNRITQRKTPPSPVGFFVSYESGGRFSGGVLCPRRRNPRLHTAATRQVCPPTSPQRVEIAHAEYRAVIAAAKSE